MWWTLGYAIAFGKGESGANFNQFVGGGGYFAKNEVCLSRMLLSSLCIYVCVLLGIDLSQNVLLFFFLLWLRCPYDLSVCVVLGVQTDEKT